MGRLPLAASPIRRAAIILLICCFIIALTPTNKYGHVVDAWPSSRGKYMFQYTNNNNNGNNNDYYSGGGGGGGGSRGKHPAARHYEQQQRRRRTYHANERNNDNGYSPNFDMYDMNDEYDGNDNNDVDGSQSFYERNNLKPPPLISRAERHSNRYTNSKGNNKRRRAQQSDSDADAELTEEATTQSTTQTESLSELDEIISTSKLGLDHATLLRQDLLQTPSASSTTTTSSSSSTTSSHGYGYDKHAYPWSYAWHSQPPGFRTGIPVEFSLNFHRVFSVDVVHPVLDLVVWMRIEWVDPRLTWIPSEYGNLTKSWFWIGDGGAGGETSEVWTPDIELWNLEEGLRESFDDAYAIVSYDGSVWWSRPGHLRPACKFYGLREFPFDKLSCAIEFGSWVYSGKYMRLVKGGGTGYSIGGSETAGESFNEFSFVEENAIDCKEVVYPPYPASPEEDWPVLLYNITIERSWQPYVRGYITMQVLLNIVGFAAFWLPPSCGERMGLSITAMLAAVAAEIVVADGLPAAAEYTWFQKFSLVSMLFAFISLIESVAVLYFYYKRSEDMIPWWFSEFRKWYVFRQARKHGGEVIRHSAIGAQEMAKRASDLVHETSDRVADNIHRRTSTHSELDNDKNQPHDPKYDDEDSFSENENKEKKIVMPDNDSSVESFEEENKDKVATDLMISHEDNSKDGTLTDNQKEKASSIAVVGSNSQQNGGFKVETVEEEDSSLEMSDRDYGVIETGNRSSGRLGDSMISNLSFDGQTDIFDRNHSVRELTPSRQGMRRGQSRKVNFSGVNKLKEPNDGLHREEEPGRRPNLSLAPGRRSGMLQSLREADSLRSFIVPRDADDFNNEEEVEHNRKWKNISARIDDVARFWIPFTFAIVLAVILTEPHR